MGAGGMGGTGGVGIPTGGVTGVKGGAAGARGGMAIDLHRKRTAEKRLDILWDHPRGGEEVLDFRSALEEIRGRDLRPLLVLRDCESCKGEDDALIYRRMNNEKTQLYSRWFHCVKLDRRVTKKNHPYHNLFAGKNPPHLFVASWDGKQIVRMNGRQPMKVLHSAMLRVLRTDYKKDPKSAVRAWLRCLDKYDSLDSRGEDLLKQVRHQQERGHDKRVKKLRGKLAVLDGERQRVKKSENRIFDLILKRAPKKKTVADFDDEAAAAVKAGRGGLLDRLRKKKQDADK